MNQIFSRILAAFLVFLSDMSKRPPLLLRQASCRCQIQPGQHCRPCTHSRVNACFCCICNGSCYRILLDLCGIMFRSIPVCALNRPCLLCTSVFIVNAPEFPGRITGCLLGTNKRLPRAEAQQHRPPPPEGRLMPRSKFLQNSTELHLSNSVLMSAAASTHAPYRRCDPIPSGKPITSSALLSPSSFQPSDASVVA